MEGFVEQISFRLEWKSKGENGDDEYDVLVYAGFPLSCPK